MQRKEANDLIRIVKLDLGQTHEISAEPQGDNWVIVAVEKGTQRRSVFESEGHYRNVRNLALAKPTPGGEKEFEARVRERLPECIVSPLSPMQKERALQRTVSPEALKKERPAPPVQFKTKKKSA